MEITTAQAGKLERAWCHRRNDESRPWQDLNFDDCVVRMLDTERKRKTRRRRPGCRQAHVGMGTASSLISNGWEGCKRTASWSMWDDRAGDSTCGVQRKTLIDTYRPHLASLSLSLTLPTPPLSLSTMPFERYLCQTQEPQTPPSSSPPINDYANVQSNYPSSLGSTLDPFAATPALHFQMPQFMLDGPPTLAPGGGAEVLPAGFVSSKSLTSAWIANTGFAPSSSEDVYVRLH